VIFDNRQIFRFTRQRASLSAASAEAGPGRGKAGREKAATGLPESFGPARVNDSVDQAIGCPAQHAISVQAIFSPRRNRFPTSCRPTGIPNPGPGQARFRPAGIPIHAPTREPAAGRLRKNDNGLNRDQQRAQNARHKLFGPRQAIPCPAGQKDKTRSPPLARLAPQVGPLALLPMPRRVARFGDQDGRNPRGIKNSGGMGSTAIADRR